MPNDLTTAPATTPLSDVPVGSTVVVAALSRSSAALRRLGEMGLTPGCELRVVRVAPLGDPVEVSLRGYRLSLRKQDAADVETVAPGDWPPA
ncbi:MAG: ferrous iron transport protein A [Bifidobacteriaceae bacterium]|jgi:Fe2+ transport system protein FeoA|nr:ferrous iron transport protein A [Bifidobacteriaceae bacterium]